MSASNQSSASEQDSSLTSCVDCSSCSHAVNVCRYPHRRPTGRPFLNVSVCNQDYKSRQVSVLEAGYML